MAKDFEDGVWRTIGGRRVFIKDGQSLSDAMKESGKFKKTEKVKKEETTKTSDSGLQKRLNELEEINQREKENQKDPNYEKELSIDPSSYAKTIKEPKTEFEKLAKQYQESQDKITQYNTERHNMYKGAGFEDEKAKDNLSASDYKKYQELTEKYDNERANAYNIYKKMDEEFKKGGSPSNKEMNESIHENRVQEAKDFYGKDESKSEIKMTKDDLRKELDSLYKEPREDEIKKDLKDIKNEREKKELTKKGLTDDEIKKGYKDVNEALKDKKESANEKDWRSQVKANNEKMEKDVTDLQNKINEYRNKSIEVKDKDALKSYQYLKEAEKLTDQYYERFRENERANAKIKVEKPNEKYENIEAYAGYKEKFNSTWGQDGSNEKVVSAKMYTNDEFMEHLEDANWHSERRALLEANLTNEQLSYIKDKTKVSAWGVENLTGKEQVEKMIKEAKSQKNSISNSLRQKAYEKYMKEHPLSKISFEEFKDMNKKK